MQLVVWTTLLIIGYVSASPAANNYIETILNTTLRDQIRLLMMDPAPLPDFTVEFEDRMRVVGKVKGKAEYSDGRITGLSGVMRRSECEGPFVNYGIKSITCTCSFEKIKIKYEGRMKYGKMPTVNIEAKAKSKNHTMTIEIIQNPPLKPIVKNITMQPFSTMEMKHEGLGPFNGMASTVLNEKFGQFLNTTIYNSISQRYEFALNQAVANAPLP